jgi:iron-sulfur cluster assembly enzyme ISCU, mitochondrial
MLRRTSSTAPRVAGRAISATSRSATRPATLQTSPTIAASRRQYHARTYTRPVASQILPTVISGRRQYHEKVLDHYSRPRNVGSMSKTDTDVGTGLVGAPACGDVMKLQIRVDPSNNTISDVKFKTFGCGSAIASSSYLTELVRGMTLEEAGRVRNTEIAKELCLPPVKRELQFLYGLLIASH